MRRRKIFPFSAGGTLAALAFEFMAWSVGKLPKKTQRSVAQALGYLFGQIASTYRQSVTYNLEHLFTYSKFDIEKFTNRIFRNFGLTLYDFFFPGNVTVNVPERKKLENIVNQKKGVMVLTFHMGHWELGARVMSEWGWPVTAVYQPYQNERFKRVIEKRRAPKVNFIPVGGQAASGVRTALKRGDVVAMLGDHPFGEEGTPVQLLGKTVLWPKGPILLAVKEMVPIIIAVIIRKKDGTYEAIVGDPLIPKEKTRSEVQRLVQAVADKFGNFATDHLDQWYRFRKFEFVSK
jgi:lauroyl/myristoyl acyltransferase